MKLEDFRNPELARNLVGAIHKAMPEGAFTIMEVCGGQTHTIYKYRLRELLPEGLRLISGPGCPVCVTPISYIDKAVSLVLDHECVIYTFGDLMRVPGTQISLERAAAEGGDIRAVYSPLDAVKAAQAEPHKQIVFLGIGFETTMPASALPIVQAAEEGLANFSILLSGKRVPPVLEAVLSSPRVEVDGFITPGHVTAIIGAAPYAPLCSTYHVPMAVGGFEPLDLLAAILELVKQFAAGTHENINAYRRAVPDAGNPKAQTLIEKVFTVVDDELRGLGILPEAGFAIRDEFSEFDADKKFEIKTESREPAGCRCGEILCGILEPEACPLFRKACTPDSPVGSCMVSAEGACNAAYLYG